MATSAGISCIDRAEASRDGTRVVVQSVTVAEAHGIVGVGIDPVGLRVVGHGAVEENGGDSGRKGVTLRDFHVPHVQSVVVTSGEAKG